MATLGSLNFGLPTFDQSNPWMVAAQKIGQMRAQDLANQQNQTYNQFQPALLGNEQLRGSLANQLATATLPYAGPRAAAELLQEELANKKSVAEELYWGPQAQATLAETQARAPYIRAQTGLENLKLQFPGLFGTGAAEQLATAQYYRTHGQPGLANQIQQLAMQSKGGLSITGTPGGGFTITQGGGQITPVPGAANAPGDTGVPNQAAGEDFGTTQQGDTVIRSPFAPQSSRSTAGSTLTDINTGQSTSIPTLPTTTVIQKALTSSNIVTPQLKSIFRDTAATLSDTGLKSDLKKLGVEAQQYVLGDSPAYNKMVASEGTIRTSSESILKSMGLEAGKSNREAVEDMLRRSKNDTVKSFAFRMANLITQLKLRDEAYVKTLTGGIPLNAESRSKLSDQLRTGMANELIASITPAPKIPSWVRTKDDQVRWFASLPIEQKIAFRNKAKGA